MIKDIMCFIVLEQCGFPGNIGDSAAETGRYLTMANDIVDLSPFVTDKGVLRHPTSPWREDDTSSDQVAPLIAAADLTGQDELADKIIDQIRANHYRTGNGTLVSPGLVANIRRHQHASMLWLSDLAILGQAILFKLPIRWSDSKKWFESNADSSADYLNFVNALVFARRTETFNIVCRLTLRLTSPDIIMQKVKDYYKPEPNSDWIIALYQKNVDLIYGDS